MAYNPGIQYIGGQLIGQGITEAGRAIGGAIQQRHLDQKQAATEAKQQAEMAKKVAEMTRGMRTVAKHLPGMSKEQVETMGYNELGTVLQNYSLMSAAEQQKAERQRQAEMAAAVRKFIPGPGEQGPLPSADQVNRLLLQEPGFVNNIDPNMVMQMLPREAGPQAEFITGPQGNLYIKQPDGKLVQTNQESKQTPLMFMRIREAKQEALAAGDKELANDLEILLQKEKMLPPKFRMETRDDGTQVMEYGPQIGQEATYSERSKIQEQDRRIKESLELVRELKNNLKPENMGVRGFLGNQIIDKKLAALIPGIGNDERITQRQAVMSASEAMLRTISSDRGALSDKDRKAALQILVNTNWDESYDVAMGKLTELEKILQRRKRIADESLTGEESSDPNTQELSSVPMADLVARARNGDQAAQSYLHQQAMEKLKSSKR